MTSARAGERSGAPGVDEWLDADLEFPSGARGSVRASMVADRWDFGCRLVGSRGDAFAPSFVLPHLDDRVIVSGPDGECVEHLGRRSSYTFQLEAFARTVRLGEPFPTDATDAVATLTLIDAATGPPGCTPGRAQAPARQRRHNPRERRRARPAPCHSP